jgi:hypothetical protein
MDNVCEEQHGLLRSEVADGVDLDQFQELIDRKKQVGEAPRRLSQGPDEV